MIAPLVAAVAWEWGLPMVGYDVDPGPELTLGEWRASVALACRKLSGFEVLALYLRAHGYTYHEMGAMLHISHAAARTNVLRAMETLARNM